MTHARSAPTGCNEFSRWPLQARAWAVLCLRPTADGWRLCREPFESPRWWHHATPHTPARRQRWMHHTASSADTPPHQAAPSRHAADASCAHHRTNRTADGCSANRHISPLWHHTATVKHISNRKPYNYHSLSKLIIKLSH
jgi:hypothetical protein